MTNYNWAEISVSSLPFSSADYSPEMQNAGDQDIHPPFSFRGIPLETASMAIIMEKFENGLEVFDHWVIWNMPPTAAIAQGSASGIIGKNGHGHNTYIGPCTPFGDYYRLQVYALNKFLALEENNGKQELKLAMDGHILAIGCLDTHHRDKSLAELLEA